MQIAEQKRSLYTHVYNRQTNARSEQQHMCFAVNSKFVSMTLCTMHNEVLVDRIRNIEAAAGVVISLGIIPTNIDIPWLIGRWEYLVGVSDPFEPADLGDISFVAMRRAILAAKRLDNRSAVMEYMSEIIARYLKIVREDFMKLTAQWEKLTGAIYPTYATLLLDASHDFPLFVTLE
jgi:hypothetical protein